MDGWADWRMGGLVLALSSRLPVPSFICPHRPPIRPPAHRPIRPSTRSSSKNGNIFDRDDATPDWVAHLANKLHVRPASGWCAADCCCSGVLGSIGTSGGKRAGPALPRGVPVGARRYRSLSTRREARAARGDVGRWSTQPQASFTSAGGDKTGMSASSSRNFSAPPRKWC